MFLSFEIPFFIYSLNRGSGASLLAAGRLERLVKVICALTVLGGNAAAAWPLTLGRPKNAAIPAVIGAIPGFIWNQNAGQVEGWFDGYIEDINPRGRYFMHAFITGPNGEGMRDLEVGCFSGQ